VDWTDTVIEAAQTDTGMRRSNNQDSYAIVRATNPQAWRQRGHVYMVADGMGAHAVGELASKLACDNIPHNYTKAKNTSPAEALTRAYREVGTLINGKATANRDFQGMGTTCSTLILLPAGALIAHVGDSRVYRIREGRIDQLTFDHSLVWELVKHKHLTPEQAQKAVPRNVITRSLGPEPDVAVDVEGPYPVEPGDVYLVCSDGLSGPVSEHEMGAFAASFHPEQACRYLIHLANLRGGPDNITAVIVRIGEWVEPGSEPVPVAAAAKSASSRGFRLASLLSGLRAPKAPPVEEHIYQSAECALDEMLLTRLSEDVRHAQALAIDQGWNLDWGVLANLRREAEDARAEGDYRASLRCLGEAISMLGQAGRIFRKDQANNGAHR
jgi:serine/threonine protein phosphatase PrpC